MDKSGFILIDKTNPRENKYLLVLSQKSKYGFPKGTFDSNLDKSLQDCARRELEEETGLQLLNPTFKKRYSVKNNLYFIEDLFDIDRELKLMHEKIPDSSEIHSFNWYTFPEMINLKNKEDCNMGLKSFINDLEKDIQPKKRSLLSHRNKKE